MAWTPAARVTVRGRHRREGALAGFRYAESGLDRAGHRGGKGRTVCGTARCGCQKSTVAGDDEGQANSYGGQQELRLPPGFTPMRFLLPPPLRGDLGCALIKPRDGSVSHHRGKSQLFCTVILRPRPCGSVRKALTDILLCLPHPSTVCRRGFQGGPLHGGPANHSSPLQLL